MRDAIHPFRKGGRNPSASREGVLHRTSMGVCARRFPATPNSDHDAKMAPASKDKKKKKKKEGVIVGITQETWGSRDTRNRRQSREFGSLFPMAVPARAGPVRGKVPHNCCFVAFVACRPSPPPGPLSKTSCQKGTRRDANRGESRLRGWAVFVGSVPARWAPPNVAVKQRKSRPGVARQWDTPR